MRLPAAPPPTIVCSGHPPPPPRICILTSGRHRQERDHAAARSHMGDFVVRAGQARACELKRSRGGQNPPSLDTPYPLGTPLLALLLRFPVLVSTLLFSENLDPGSTHPNRHLPVPFLVCVWGWVGVRWHAMGGAACISLPGAAALWPAASPWWPVPLPQPPAEAGSSGALILPSDLCRRLSPLGCLV